MGEKGAMKGWQNVILIGLVIVASALQGQEYGARLGTVQRGGKVSFEPTGPGVLFDALDPAVRKWYVPQELYAEYRWKQWEYSNYARENYQRYVSTNLEGEYFYDVYGNFLTRGWLIYDWRQSAPQPFGSTLEKTGQFNSWFNSLVIASDHKGQYHYAITLGSQIRTTLTPMTFSKPLFNGLQWDFATDKWETTLLLSRISEPSSPGGRPDQSSNVTNLFAGRLVAQVGDFVKIGGTFVNAHHSQTQLEALSGNISQGQLTEAQNFTTIDLVEIRIKDDSPEDGEGGGALFGSDILIYDLEGNWIRGRQIGFRPLVEGGFQRQGYLAADGTEEILLSYDFLSPTYSGPDPSEITQVQIELVVANDYLIEIASNGQVDAGESIAFLPVAQARGNVQDGSNQRVLLLDYGLPTANQIAGFTLELIDLAGLEGYAEVNINHQYRQYPNPNLHRHHTSDDEALAWLVNLWRSDYPFFVFGEFFGIDPHYATAMVVTDAEGVIDYDNQFQRFEFVDDNDDQDRRPDWRRKSWGPGDDEVFPGWDENNDFISDFNQNDNEDSPNLIPDYEEPFLRFYADRPEFLYGVDMNHNGTIDRFENDEEADYPYRRDQKGFNAYGGLFVAPGVKLTLGHMRVRQLSDRRHNRALYLLTGAEKNHPRWGRVRFFQDVRKVEDTIKDDLLQWKQLPNTRGSLRLEPDLLPARNTWISTTYLGLKHSLLAGLELTHKMKWQFHRQLDDDETLELRGLRQGASFFGLIDKVEYNLTLGSWTLLPRWKSELRRQTPLLSAQARRLELTELFILVARFPVLRRSFVEGGMEYEWFKQLRDPVPPGADPSFTGLTATVQLTNISEYQGYRLSTTAGFELHRLDFKFEPVQHRTRGFITIYAGVER